MKIKIIEFIKGEETTVLTSDYSYMENQSSQEGMPSFYIDTQEGKNNGFQIHFFAEKLEEIDKLIENLKEIRKDMASKQKDK